MFLKRILSFLLLFCCACNPLAAIHVCIVQNWAPSESEFFNPSGGRDEGAKAIYMLKTRLEELGHRLSTMEDFCNFKDADYIIAFNYLHNPTLDDHMSRAVPADRLFLFLWEPPSTDPGSYNPIHHTIFGRVYTCNDDLVDGKKYHKLFYPSLRKPMIEAKTDFAQKKLCTLIACNKSSKHPNELYTQRCLAIHFFEKYHPLDFDLYGPGWLPYSTYRGTIKEKAPVLEKYKFCLAYENVTGINGYVTEKIFDCFYAGCVPIYWGATNVEQYIPANCFIDRRAFRTNEDLYQFLKNMTEVEHQNYLSNIKAYLESSQSLQFTPEYFVEWFIKQVLEIDS